MRIRSLIVAAIALVAVSGCDPSPPSWVGLSGGGGDAVVVHVSACSDRAVQAVYVTSDVNTLVYGEVVDAAKWGVEADGEAHRLEELTLGELPTGYRQVGVFDRAGLVESDQVVVFFGPDYRFADTESFGDLIRTPSESVIMVEGAPVAPGDFDRCDDG